MAEVTGNGNVGNDKYWRHSWETLGNGDTGAPVRKSELTDKTVQVTGTFGASGEVTMQGSHDGASWFTMKDISDNDAVVTSAGAVVLKENPRYIRPNITNGDGTTDLDVVVGASAAV